MEKAQQLEEPIMVNFFGPSMMIYIYHLLIRAKKKKGER